MAQAQVISIVSAQKRTHIINRFLDLSRQIAALKKEQETLKLSAIELLGEGQHKTKDAKLTIQWVSRPIFDQATAKSFLTAGQLAQCSRESAYFDVRIKGSLK